MAKVHPSLIRGIPAKLLMSNDGVMEMPYKKQGMIIATENGLVIPDANGAQTVAEGSPLAPLEFDSAYVDTDGTHLYVTFSGSIETVNSDWASGFIVKVNGQIRQIASALQDDPAVVELTMAAIIYNTDTVTLSFGAKNGYLNSAGIKPLSVLGESVANNSAQVD